jgi:hypothetical protein
MIEEYQTTDDVCDGLLTLFDECQEVAQPGKISIQDEKHQGYGVNVVESSVKMCTDLFWGDIPKTGVKSHPRFKDQEYLHHITQCVTDYSNQYLSGHPLKMYGNPKFQYYKKGEAFFAEHYDAGDHTHRRVIAYITYLNTVTDGGGTYFRHQDYTVQPIKGKTVLFPPYYTHLHRGVVSLTQEKYIVTGWYTWNQ